MSTKEKWYVAIQETCAREIVETVKQAKFDTAERVVNFREDGMHFRCESLGAALKYLEQVYRQTWWRIATEAEPDDLEMTNAIGAALVLNRTKFGALGWSLEGV